MEAKFWENVWEARDRCGFQQEKPHDWLVRFHEEWKLPPGSVVFVPLCGKSIDLKFLSDRGYFVKGVELVPGIIEEFFAENSLPFKKTGKHFQNKNFDLVEGDVFDLPSSWLNDVRGIYDRAAVVALNEKQRMQYIQKITKACPLASWILIAYEFAPLPVDPPPHHVSESEVQKFFPNYSIEKIASRQRPSEEGERLEKGFFLKPRKVNS